MADWSSELQKLPSQQDNLQWSIPASPLGPLAQYVLHNCSVTHPFLKPVSSGVWTSRIPHLFQPALHCSVVCFSIQSLIEVELRHWWHNKPCTADPSENIDVDVIQKLINFISTCVTSDNGHFVRWPSSYHVDRESIYSLPLGQTLILYDHLISRRFRLFMVL